MTYAAITYAKVKPADDVRSHPTICFHFFSQQTDETAAMFAADLALMGHHVASTYKSRSGQNALNVAFQPGTDLNAIIDRLMPNARQGSAYEYTA